jgi:hypothetical protein
MLIADERAETFVLFAAGWAAGEVRAQAGNGGVCVRARDFELDVAVELLEAFVAADLRLGGSEQIAQGLLEIPWFHGFTSSSHVSRARPDSVR